MEAWSLDPRRGLSWVAGSDRLSSAEVSGIDGISCISQCP